MSQAYDFGKEAEGVALSYLCEQGYKIWEANWRYNKKEIDIIAQQEDVLVIVEVKARKTDYFGRPEEAVTLQKQRFLIEAAEAFATLHEIDMEIRFDVIALLKKGLRHELTHLKDAFNPL